MAWSALERRRMGVGYSLPCQRERRFLKRLVFIKSRSMRLTPDHAGRITVTGPGKGTHESDACRCIHCGKIWVVRSSNPSVKADLGGWCRNCMAMICSFCAGKPCMHLYKKLELYESRQRLFLSSKGCAGFLVVSDKRIYRLARMAKEAKNVLWADAARNRVFPDS